ncbi:MAG TPA: hypothetical protein VN784_08215 [Candidatus Limnocylindrales bacterium]|nr:hypothetical protein [Candidatus Limnocylindrales bacterium]
MHIAVLIASTLGLRAGAQTNSTPVVSTNFVTAVPWFREVNGQLYNIQRSVLWQTLYGDILKVSTNELVVSTFTMEPVYEAATTSREVDNYMGGIGGYRQVPTQLQTGEKKVYGAKIIVLDCPENLNPAVAETIQLRVMRVGTTNYNGDVLELWDCGTPHVLKVVTTNYARAFDVEKGKQ